MCTGHVSHMVERGGYRVLVGKPEGKRTLENPGINGRIILRWIFRNEMGGMGLIDLAQDRDRSWALVNAVMNLWVP